MPWYLDLGLTLLLGLAGLGLVWLIYAGVARLANWLHGLAERIWNGGK